MNDYELDPRFWSLFENSDSADPAAFEDPDASWEAAESEAAANAGDSSAPDDTVTERTPKVGMPVTDEEADIKSPPPAPPNNSVARKQEVRQAIMRREAALVRRHRQDNSAWSERPDPEFMAASPTTDNTRAEASFVSSNNTRAESDPVSPAGNMREPAAGGVGSSPPPPPPVSGTPVSSDNDRDSSAQVELRRQNKRTSVAKMEPTSRSSAANGKLRNDAETRDNISATSGAEFGAPAESAAEPPQPQSSDRAVATRRPSFGASSSQGDDAPPGIGASQRSRDSASQGSASLTMSNEPREIKGTLRLIDERTAEIEARFESIDSVSALE